MQQWTYVYWDGDSWTVMHQTPDALWPGRVHSTIIAKGYHDMPYDHPQYGSGYAEKQREIGLPYASQEWPLRTCDGRVIEVQS